MATLSVILIGTKGSIGKIKVLRVISIYWFENYLRRKNEIENFATTAE
jgi:hypothetical protein